MQWLRDGAECAPGCSGTGWPRSGSLHMGEGMRALSLGLLPGALMVVLSDEPHGWVQTLELGNFIVSSRSCLFLEKQGRKKAKAFHLFSKPSRSKDYILLLFC